MANAKYLGMNRNSGLAIEDLDHIRQSLSDILGTPIGSRIMRREYGSMLSDLIDMPMNPALPLQIMAACYMAVLKWEPRVNLTGITYGSTEEGKMVVEMTGTRVDTAAAFSISLPVS